MHASFPCRVESYFCSLIQSLDTRPSALSQLYPCRLSLLLLPVQQMLSVAALADTARRFCAVFEAPWTLRFKVQLIFVGAHFVKALGAAGIAGFAYWWIRQNKWARRWAGLSCWLLCPLREAGPAC